MNLFLDSSAIIDLFRNDKDVIDILSKADEVYTSSICAYEVLLGEMYNDKKGRQSALEKMQKFFEVMVTLPFTYNDSLKASEITAMLSIKGKKVDDFDVLIASQALALGSTVLTKNAKHFEIIKEETGLPIYIV